MLAGIEPCFGSGSIAKRIYSSLTPLTKNTIPYIHQIVNFVLFLPPMLKPICTVPFTPKSFPNPLTHQQQQQTTVPPMQRSAVTSNVNDISKRKHKRSNIGAKDRNKTKTFDVFQKLLKQKRNFSI
jgi:hypothetical protein